MSIGHITFVHGHHDILVRTNKTLYLISNVNTKDAQKILNAHIKATSVITLIYFPVQYSGNCTITSFNFLI